LLEELEADGRLGVDGIDPRRGLARVPCPHRLDPGHELRIGGHVPDQPEELVRFVGKHPDEVVSQRLQAAASFALRAACSRAKSSPAWCEERVRGLAETIRKPLALAISSSALNSSGCQNRSIGACLR